MEGKMGRRGKWGAARFEALYLTKSMCICMTQPTIIRGVSIDRLPDLKCALRETRIDGMTWQTWYRCNECGQEWLERYVPTGHGEIPEVVKLSAVG